MDTRSRAQTVGRSVLCRVRREVARPARRELNGTRVIASMFGVCVGVSGLDQGFFEALQGDRASDAPW